MLVLQFLGARFQAFGFQSIDKMTDSSPRTENSCNPPCRSQATLDASTAILASAQHSICSFHESLVPAGGVADDTFADPDCRHGTAREGAIEVADVVSVGPASDAVKPHADGLTKCLRPFVADLSLVESVKGLEGLKAALAAKFMSDQNTLADSFRCGYIVDLNQHWISVHVFFDKRHSSNSLSLIVFDTLEVNYQHYHQVGLLRSSSTRTDIEKPLPDSEFNLWWENDGVDVVTLCGMLGIQYNIAFLAPICDMRRLTWEEEDEIRAANKGASSKSTVYYDQRGNPFRKIIVQPILQAEQDGTCKSRALAVLGWLLRLDENALAWYVASHRELFQVELKASPGCGGKKRFKKSIEHLDADVDESHSIFGSLMSTGKRDKFGRAQHMKVCHVETSRYNKDVDEIRADTLQQGRRADRGSEAALLPSDCRETSLRRRREEELHRIKEVLLQSRVGGNLPRSLDLPSLESPAGAVETGEEDRAAACSSQGWRAIEDHEARWHFLEETCFFGHNLGFRKIKRMYPRDEILVKELPVVGAIRTSPENTATAPSVSGEDNGHGFGATKYLRKYIVPSSCGSYITHEADPMFHKPLENFFNFLCRDDEDERVVVPFYVLPFPGSFMGLSLDDYVQGTNLMILDLEGDPDEHSRQKVSDFSLPSGNNFLNDPISYNKVIANVSLPVKLTV